MDQLTLFDMLGAEPRLTYHIPKHDRFPACDHCTWFRREPGAHKTTCALTDMVVSFMGYCSDWARAKE